MKIFDKKVISASILTIFVLMCVLLVNNENSYALPDLSVPEITSFTKSTIEDNALKVEFKSSNTGSNFSYELLNTNTGAVNILSGSTTGYTYQNLEADEYKIQMRACTNDANNYSCTDYSEVKSATLEGSSEDASSDNDTNAANDSSSNNNSSTSGTSTGGSSTSGTSTGSSSGGTVTPSTKNTTGTGATVTKTFTLLGKEYLLTQKTNSYGNKYWTNTFNGTRVSVGNDQFWAKVTDKNGKVKWYVNINGEMVEGSQPKGKKYITAKNKKGTRVSLALDENWRKVTLNDGTKNAKATLQLPVNGKWVAATKTTNGNWRVDKNGKRYYLDSSKKLHVLTKTTNGYYREDSKDGKTRKVYDKNFKLLHTFTKTANGNYREDSKDGKTRKVYDKNGKLLQTYYKNTNGRWYKYGKDKNTLYIVDSNGKILETYKKKNNKWVLKSIASTSTGSKGVRCSGGKTYSQSKKKCVCPSSRPYEKSGGCYDKKHANCIDKKGYHWSGGKCVQDKVVRCSGGKTYSQSKKKCVCPKSRPYERSGGCYDKKHANCIDRKGYHWSGGKCVKNSTNKTTNKTINKITNKTTNKTTTKPTTKDLKKAKETGKKKEKDNKKSAAKKKTNCKKKCNKNYKFKVAQWVCKWKC